jgi:hypothetical protein
MTTRNVFEIDRLMVLWTFKSKASSCSWFWFSHCGLLMSQLILAQLILTGWLPWLLRNLEVKTNIECRVYSYIKVARRNHVVGFPDMHENRSTLTVFALAEATPKLARKLTQPK